MADADDIVNLGELADLLECSEQKIKRLIKLHPATHPNPFPVAKGGSNGVPYEFAAGDVAAWWHAHQADVMASDEERAGKIKQMRLELLGGTVTGETMAGMTGRMRREEIEAEFAAMKLSKARGALVEVELVEQCLAVSFAAFRAEMQNLSATLGRALTLDRDSRNRIDQAVGDSLKRLGDGLTDIEAYRTADAA